MIKIKNWDKFQHFKDRNPPWIKLYRELLNDPEWFELSGNDAKNLVSLWLLASEDEKREGYLPDIKVISFRLRISQDQVKQTLARLSAYLISDGYQLDAPETETETEKRHILCPEIDQNPNSRTCIAKRCIDFLNQKAGRRYKHTDANLKFITSRLKEGYSETEIRQVTALKVREWKGTDMDEYLRPATLFNREKFNQYAGLLKATEGDNHGEQ